jgi:hypothetical protein
MSATHHHALAVAGLSAAVALGCGGSAAPTTAATDSTDQVGASLTYYRDAKPIIDARCATCHLSGDIAPFALSSYAEVKAVAPLLSRAIESGSMPPWPPAKECNDYQHDRSLSSEEQQLLLDWLSAGAAEGDPKDAPEPALPEKFPSDLVLSPEGGYTPEGEPDDYRCRVLPWDAATQTFITGYEVRPDQRALVHHVILYVVDPEDAAEVDRQEAEDAEAGYRCFGGVGVMGRWVGSWTPGATAQRFPLGTGMRVDPGSRLVMQMHYNTSSSAPVADQSRVSLTTASSVERPLSTIRLAEPGWITGKATMTIPAGQPSVVHATRQEMTRTRMTALGRELGMEPGEPILIHTLGLHMHYLGQRTHLRVLHPDGSASCGLQIDDWDFAWQGGYSPTKPLEVNVGDELELSCEWNNSAENQPIIDGAIAEPVDVAWGESTRDEMCLAMLVASRK